MIDLRRECMRKKTERKKASDLGSYTSRIVILRHISNLEEGKSLTLTFPAIKIW